MSDQHVITDWRAYLEALGPGRPFAPSQLEAMRDKEPKVVLILDERPGMLMSRHVLADEDAFEAAAAKWEAAGKPRAWLMLGNSSAPWFCDAASLPSKSKVRSRS